MYFISMMMLLFICHLWVFRKYTKASPSCRRLCLSFHSPEQKSISDQRNQMKLPTERNCLLMCFKLEKINSVNINWIYVYCSLLLFLSTLFVCLPTSLRIVVSVSSQSSGLVFSPTTYFVGPHSQHRAGHHVLQDAYIANIYRDVFLIIVVSLLTEDGDTLHEIKMDDVRIIWNLFFRGKKKYKKQSKKRHTEHTQDDAKTSFFSPEKLYISCMEKEKKEKRYHLNYFENVEA